MSLAAHPNLEPGRAYRTHELLRFGANPTRLAKRLVAEGKLRQASHGLFYAPMQSRFGAAPPSDEEILFGFLGSNEFVLTGPPKWNTLGLGATAMFASSLIYNHKRTGEFIFDGRRFLLRRVFFPPNPSPEWYVIDLLQHHDMAGVSLTELRERLVATLREERWNRGLLLEMAEQYATKATRALIEGCLRETGNVP
jgi:hypothetical protein